MEQETIEKAAFKYGCEHQVAPATGGELEKGFINGAHWRINAVWHDAHEEPQRSGMLIASNEDGNYILCGPNNSNWKQTVKLFRIMNWAYIIDLLPERKEETK